MREFVLMLLLASLSGSVAAKWVRVGESNASITYADPSTVRRTGDIVKMWVLHDFKKAKKRDSGKNFLSMKYQQEYDCKGETDRNIFAIAHAGRMGTGNVVGTLDEPGKWMPVVPESVGETLWRFACEKR